jgi:hypothetical protein
MKRRQFATLAARDRVPASFFDEGVAIHIGPEPCVGVR